MKNKAFTLAEVLITLSIIGVVAALTIPAVVKNYKETQTISQLKKAYATLSGATSMVVAQYGPIENLDFKDGKADDMENIFLAYKPYLHITKFCKNTPGCWTTKQTRTLNGGDPGNTEAGLGGGIYVFVLNNGMKVNMDMFGLPAPAKFGVTTKTSALLIFTVDLNGDKGPNILGRDVFAFALTEKGMVPAGFANNSAYCTTTSSFGWDCTAKVLKENAIKY